MSNLVHIKKELIHLALISPEKHKESDLHSEIGSEQMYYVPILTLVAIPWNTWSKTPGEGYLSEQRVTSSVLGNTREKHEINIEVVAQKPKGESYEEIISLMENPNSKNENNEKKTIYLQCRIEETLLVESNKRNALPPKNRRSFERITGTWEEFCEYFEGNKEAGWKDLILGKEQVASTQTGYVPPLCLHIDLSLMEENNLDFKACGIPTGENLCQLIQAIRAPKNRVLTTILHGRPNVVSAYIKELNKTLPVAIPQRFNHRCLVPVEMTLADGICNSVEKDTDPTTIRLIWESIPKWKKTKKSLATEQAQEIEQYKAKIKQQLIKKALWEIAINHDQEAAAKWIDAYSINEIPSAEELEENEDLPQKLKKLLQNPPSGLETWIADNNVAERLRRKTEHLSITGGLNSGINRLQHAYQLAEIWPELMGKLGNPTFEDPIAEAYLQIEETIVLFKKWAAQTKSLEQSSTLTQWVKGNEDIDESPSWKTAMEAWHKLESKLDQLLKDKAAKAQEEVKTIIEFAETKIQAEPTTLTCVQLYAEISQKTPEPKEQETLKLTVEKHGNIAKSTWNQICEQLGKIHTEVFTYYKTENGRKWANLKLPQIPEPYLEPATLPSIHASLQEESLLNVITNWAEAPEKAFQEQRREITLSTQLKPITDPITELYLDIDERQIEIFNPVIGKPTGFKSTLLWRPTLAKQGISWAQKSLNQFGYELNASPEVHNFAEKKVKKGEKVLSPNYALTQYRNAGLLPE